MCDYSLSWDHLIYAHKFNLKIAASELDRFSEGFTLLSQESFLKCRKGVWGEFHFWFTCHTYCVTNGILLYEMRDGELKVLMEWDLSKLKLKRMSIESSSEGYTSETQWSASKSKRCPSHSTESLLVFADYNCRHAKVWCVSCCFFLTLDLITGKFGWS